MHICRVSTLAGLCAHCRTTHSYRHVFEFGFVGKRGSCMIAAVWTGPLLSSRLQAGSSSSSQHLSVLLCSSCSLNVLACFRALKLQISLKKKTHKPQPQTCVLINWPSLTYLLRGCAFWKSPLTICLSICLFIYGMYLLWLLPTASITPSHAATAASCQRRCAAAEAEGRSAKPRFNSLGSGRRERGEGGCWGGFG